MTPRDLKELLGGFAAGTLTSAEREALFRAALEDQALFDLLADEEGLRALLADPAARFQLLSDLEEASRQGFWRRLSGWLRKPATLALAGGAAALVLMVGVVRFSRTEVAAPKLVAQAPGPPEAPRPAVAATRREAESAPRAARPQAGDMQVEAPAPVPEPAAEQKVAPPALSLPEKRSDEGQPQSMSWAVLVRDPDGSWREASPGSAFRDGDQVRLRIRPAEDGYLLIMVQDGPTVTPLGSGAGLPVRGGQEVVVPSSGALALAGASGEKLLRLSFSTGPLPAPEVGMRFTRGAAAPAAAGSRAKAEMPPRAEEIEIRLVYRPR
jgi:hypothetical protein